MAKSLTYYRGLLRQHLSPLAAKYRIASLGLFGSRVRGEERDGSDLDVLVSFHEAPTLIKFIELENELTDLLGVRVDLVMQISLKRDIGERVLKEMVPI